MEKASAVAAITEDLRNDMVWRWKILSTRPVKRLQPSESGGFDVNGESSVVTVSTDASSIHGWGAVLGDHFMQGKWSKLERREGISLKELRVLIRVLEARSSSLAGKLVLVRTDDSTAGRTPITAPVVFLSRRCPREQ